MGMEFVPTDWTSVDEDFFRITGPAFRPAFVAGAGVLLASYDEDPAEHDGLVAVPSAAEPVDVESEARAA